jgi:hypothetical protein
MSKNLVLEKFFNLTGIREMSKFEEKVDNWKKKFLYGDTIYFTGVKYTSVGQAYALIMNKVVWYAVRIFIEIDPRIVELFVFKISDFYIQKNGIKFVESVVDKLSQHSPPLTKDLPDVIGLYIFPRTVELTNREFELPRFLEIPLDVRNNPNEYLRPGDFVLGRRCFYEHAGIFIGNDEIVHFSASETADGKFKGVAKIMKTSWAKFCTDQTKSIRVLFNVLRHKKLEEVVETAIQSIGTEKGQYSLIGNNCQHFANYCLNGEKNCPEFAKLYRHLRPIIAFFPYKDLLADVFELFQYALYIRSVKPVNQ